MTDFWPDPPGGTAGGGGGGCGGVHVLTYSLGTQREEREEARLADLGAGVELVRVPAEGLGVGAGTLVVGGGEGGG